MIVALLSVFLLIGSTLSTRYEPNWKSLDARPLPSWYDEAKFGIFLHWGVFSVPSFGSEWFWWNWQGAKQMGYIDFMKNNYRPDFTYPDFAKEFHAEFFDPVYWAEIFKASGAKYIVLTSKHHEGFTNWPSQVSWNWNSMDVGPHRDLVGDLAAAIRNKTDIHFGLYHSLFEWFNPIYLKDKANNFSTQEFVFTKALPELVEIVNKYKPEVIWSDGDWEATDKYWNSTEFIAWLYNDSPVKDSVVINDRWGAGIACHHGGYYTCSDRYNPGVLLKHKWENAMTVDKFSWGYRRNAHLSDYLTIDELLQTFAETISCGGNLLMNVGPASDGIIMPIFEERLRQMGQWLGVNGEAVYSSIPWTHQNDTITPGVWYTCKNASGVVSVYAIMLNWPSDSTLVLGAPLTTEGTMVTMLGYSGEISWTRGTTTGLTMDLSPIPVNKLPCDWAWVFKLTGLASKPAYGYDQYVLRFKSETVVVDWN